MKNINNNGFVMVETIIVAVFIIGICTFLFANFLPLIGDYERVSNYDSVNAKYKVHEIKKMILRSINNNSALASLFSDIPSDKGYSIYSVVDREEEQVFEHELCKYKESQNLLPINYCNKLLSENYLGVKDIIITKFKLGKIKSSIDYDEETKKEIKRDLKEYIKYLPSYSKYGSRYDNYYRLIVSFNDGSIANIEVQYEIG